MKVKSLIALLSVMNQEATVLIEEPEHAESGVFAPYHVHEDIRYYEDDYDELLTVDATDEEYVSQEFTVKDAVLITSDR